MTKCFYIDIMFEQFHDDEGNYSIAPVTTLARCRPCFSWKLDETAVTPVTSLCPVEGWRDRKNRRIPAG